MPDNQEIVFQGVNVINEVPTLDPGIPITEDTKMYLNHELTFRQIPLSRLLEWLKGQLTKVIYPVGSVYMTFDATNPSSLFGGTWEKVEDRFLLGSGTETLGATGGESAHILTVSEMPSHAHSTSIGTSGSHSHTVNEGGSHGHTATAATNGNHVHYVGKSGYYFSVHKSFGADNDDVGRRWVTEGTSSHGVRAVTATNIYSLDQIDCTESAGNHSHNITVNNGGTHSHSMAVNGEHTHTASVTSSGGGVAHNNMPPYQVVNIWRRIA